MAASLKALIGRLNDTTRQALEAAAGFCIARSHHSVEIEHYLMRLLDNTDGDSARILRHFGIDRSRLMMELNQSLDKMKRGNQRTPAFSEELVDMFTEGWTLGSLEFGATQIRTGHTLLALTQKPQLWRLVREVSREFSRIDPSDFKKDFMTIVSGSPEGEGEAPEEVAAAAGDLGAAPVGAQRRAGGKNVASQLGRGAWRAMKFGMRSPPCLSLSAPHPWPPICNCCPMAARIRRRMR